MEMAEPRTIVRGQRVDRGRRRLADAANGLPVLFDSGIRSGADVIKALALGATAVGIGRPYAYGLAAGGTDGTVHVLRTILAEADLIMAVDGYPVIADTITTFLPQQRPPCLCWQVEV
jgi:isopentenyl diphosphate isomerase/L-lactate dehydrogenase-like FMN-dependent dehydrogenase